MSIDLAHFTPLPSLAGGLLIGLAATLLVLGNGRIAGISGILGGLLNTASGAVSYTHLDVYKRQPQRCSYSETAGSPASAEFLAAC
ncbi:hypothetical protein DRA46_00859 [Burkholderia gladioli]|nr:hypothetical protein [Burkholderia gladioli]